MAIQFLLVWDVQHDQVQVHLRNDPLCENLQRDRLWSWESNPDDERESDEERESDDERESDVVHEIQVLK